MNALMSVMDEDESVRLQHKDFASPAYSVGDESDSAAAAQRVSAHFNFGQGDLTVRGSNDDDTVTIGRDAAGTILVNGGNVPITGRTPTIANTSSIEVSGRGGDDVLTVDESQGALPAVTLSGGDGNDRLTGGSGADHLDGGSGNDVVVGGRGNDVAMLGTGNDTFVWNPGDGSDVVDGQAGTDTLQFNGANVNENIDIATDGGHVRFTRDVGAVTMDLNGIEQINFRALGGTDRVVVNDLSGTDAKQVDVDLASNAGTSDGAVDRVDVNGSAGVDRIVAATVNGETIVSGLAAEVHIRGADPGLDQLHIDAGAQNDSIDASGIAANGMAMTIDGGAGDDTIVGSKGADVLAGGSGNDVVTGGAGNDSASLGEGDDTFIWNPGDGSDIVEGDAGNDSMQFNGSGANETINVVANGQRVAISRDVGNVTMDLNSVENVTIAAGAGDDTITAGNGLATLTNLTLDGGAGNDTITGGDGNDTLLGGDGNDVITGGRGSDVARLGGGDDTFLWNPGDGSDSVEGDAGNDAMLFNGANVAEGIDISASGDHVRFTRDVGTVTMDLHGVETIDFNARAGADHVAIHDLSGTDARQINIDLSGTPGTGDAAADSVSVQGGAAAENVVVQNSGTAISVNGTPAAVAITGVESTDALSVDGGGGDDVITASTLAADAVQLTIDGGAGNDTIVGGRGADTLLGGAGNDLVTGGMGSDTALLGDGDDTFVWNPGDGSDSVDGQAGNDTMKFDGSNAGENIDISANADHVRFFRDVGAVTMDLAGVENIDFHALGGADRVVINDLAGTDAKQVNVDLSSVTGTPDNVADAVVVNATAAADDIVARTVGGETVVSGLAAEVHVAGSDAGLDQLQISGGAESDTIDASALAANSMALTVDAGAGNDLVVGSAGDDVIIGGQGADIARMGAGDDTFVWNPGDGSDTVDGEAGSDTMKFNGANISENIQIFASGDHAGFTRDIGNVSMDLHGVETVDFNALGGTDAVTVHDMTGTDVKQVNVDLAGTPAGNTGDNSKDVIVIEGTSGDDAITLSMQNGALVVNGLAAQIVIDHFDPTDEIHILGLGGNDVITATGVTVDGPSLFLDGGEGDDVLIGGDGNDVLSGGAGDDVLNGGPGLDTLDGGPGNNVLIQ